MSSNPLSSEQIADLVRCAYPEVDVVACAPFSGEHQNVNYDLRLSGPPGQAMLKVYTNESHVHEAYLLRMLTSETGVPVPRVLYLDETCTLLPHAWALLTRLPGHPLSTWIDSLDQWELESIGYEVGRYIGRVHAIPIDHFGELFRSDAPRDERTYAMERMRSCLSRLSADALPADLATPIERAFAHTALLCRERACLVHGDLTPHNILIDRGTIGYHVTGLIEFAASRASGPEDDIAHLFAWFDRSAPTLEKGFLDGYVELVDLPPDFWDRFAFYYALCILEDLASGRAKATPLDRLRAFVTSQAASTETDGN